MLYTIGSDYDECLADARMTGGVVWKIGRRTYDPDVGGIYLGGIVFESTDEAHQYIERRKLDGYDVYGLDTTLDKTYRAHDGYRHLAENAAVVDLK